MDKHTLIIGNGVRAVAIANQLAKDGSNVTLSISEASPQWALSSELPLESNVELLSETRPVYCEGCVGDFRVDLDQAGKLISCRVGWIVIAQEPQRKADFESLGLKASKHVWSLSQAMAQMADADEFQKRFPKGAKVAFLTGIARECTPVTLENVLRCCIGMQSGFGVQPYVLTGNLKVAQRGLENLYDEARKTGTVFIKLTGTMPEIRQTDDGTVEIRFTDEILHQPAVLKPDGIVVDEQILPSPLTNQLAEVFGLALSVDGFIPSDNVHRWGVTTNRRGILVAGASDPDGICMEDDILRLAGWQLGHPPLNESENKAEITWTGQCARCLTCFRVCPYRAIFRKGGRMSVMRDACEGCGICAAECPAMAVRVPGLTIDEVYSRIKDRLNHATDSPRIVAFACRRSAARAHALSRQMGQIIPSGLEIIEVPCGGSVSTGHVLAAFQNRADGVMVLTCHEGNCHGEVGTQSAGRRMEQITESMANLIGDRVQIHTLAANMGMEFARLVNEFEAKLQALGTLSSKQQ